MKKTIHIIYEYTGIRFNRPAMVRGRRSLFTLIINAKQNGLLFCITLGGIISSGKRLRSSLIWNTYSEQDDDGI